MPNQAIQNDISQSRLPFIISFSIIALLILLYFVWPAFQESINQAYRILTSGDRPRISQWVSQFGIWGPIVIILAMVVQMFLFVIPSVALMVVSVLAYGSFWGSVISLLAIFAASTVGYFIGRKLGPVTVDKLIGSKTERKMERYVNQYGLWAVIVARISPLLSNDAISFVAGLLRVGYQRFIVATGIGILPLTLLIAYLGESTERMKTGLLWISIISIIAFVAYVVYDQRKLKSS
jgi:uncharacterized membrane protein YdjX (TVP38/TMEM64 family)